MTRIKIVAAAVLLFYSLMVPVMLSSAPTSAVDFYQLGKAAESSGDFFKAVEMYKSSLILNDNFFDAVAGLAHAYYGLDEFEEALKFVLKAQELDYNNTDLLNLKGRIYLNTGKLELAQDIFSNVLKLEENNIEAEFGLAELDIASGRVVNAENRYANVLLVSPESRKALLSLVLINDSAGDFKKAEIYLRQALKYYSDNPFVRFTAADHFYKTNNIDESLFHLKTALFLQPDFLNATILLCEIYMKEKKYKNITTEIEKILPGYDDEFLLWYMLGRSYENLGDSAKAVMCYSRAIAIRPDEDLSRIALENEITAKLEMNNPLRSRYADYHVDLGQKYESRNMLDKALQEYRRALVINPYSVEARLLYADIFKRKGYIERYLLILSALVDEGLGTVDILDEIEIRRSMLEQTISEKWKTDQFTIEKEFNNISIFFVDDGMNHPEGEAVIGEYMEYLLMGYENIQIDGNTGSSDFADCFRTARENHSDYFIIFRCAENNRAVSISAEIYNADTGSKLKTLQMVRTGNQMLPEAGKATAAEVHNLLPVYGKIVNRKFDEILVNLGIKDGIKAGDELLIIKKGALQRSKNDFSLKYDESAFLGRYTVNSADELVSEGSISPVSFFDMINPGDITFFMPATDEDSPAEKPEDAQMFYTGNLFNSISNIP